MFKTILVPLDGSPLAEHALPPAIGIINRTQGKLNLALVHMVDFRGPQFDLETGRSERAYLDEVADRLRRIIEQPVAADVVEEGPIALGLLGYARAVGADMIALTTHGRGPMSRFWLGSVADELIRRADLPILVYRPEAEAPANLGLQFRPNRLVVPLDGSLVAMAALEPAADLARVFGTAIKLVRVVEPDPLLAARADDSFLDALARQAADDLARVATNVREGGSTVETDVVVNKFAAPAILAAAAFADMIVIGSHGRGGASRFFLGSVSDKVVRGATCPVLVIKNPPAGDK